MAEITTLDRRWQGDAQFNHTAFQADIVDEAGRHTRVDAKVFGVYPLVPDPDFVLNEGAAEIMIDGVPGSGWLEFRSEEHTYELQSLMRNPSAVFRLTKSIQHSTTSLTY